MGRVLRRLLTALPVLAGVLALSFLLMRLMPGDAAALLDVSPGSDGAAARAALETRLGTGGSLAVQAEAYLARLARGDLGMSVTTGRPVAEDLALRLPASLELVLAGMALALALALPAGLAAAARPGSVLDHGVRALAALSGALPTFVAGLLLIEVFYVRLGWAPDPVGQLGVFVTPPPRVTGFLLVDAALAGDGAALSDAAARLVLPAVTVALFAFAPLLRVTRAALRAALTAPHVLNARALGVARHRLLLSYVLRPGLVPVVVLAGTLLPVLLGTGVLVETVFAWPGVGRYALDAMRAADPAPLQGFVLLMAAIFVLVTLAVDLAEAVLDPRTGAS